MAGGAGCTFDPASFLSGAITSIVVLRYGGSMFAMTVVSIAVRRRLAVMRAHWSKTRLQGRNGFHPMAFAKRRDSHGLHAERQAQKQQQVAAKLAKGVHNVNNKV